MKRQNDDREQITVWITKYALTRGILKAEAELDKAHPGMAAVGYDYFHGKDWHRTEEGARARVEEMLQRKRVSLLGQLRDLEKMKPETVPVREWGTK